MQQKTEKHFYFQHTYYCLKVDGCTKATGFVKHMNDQRPSRVEDFDFMEWSILTIQVKCCKRIRKELKNEQLSQLNTV